MASKTPSQFSAGVKGHIQLQRKSYEVNNTASKIGNTAANLQTSLASLEIELKADDDGLVAMKGELERIRLEREHVEARLRKNTQAAQKYDASIGPFDQIYQTNVAAIGSLYDTAKEKHAKGINLLVEKFDYHPIYAKGKPNEFRGKPFKPK